MTKQAISLSRRRKKNRMSEGFIGLSSKKKTIKETDSDTKMLIPVLAELSVRPLFTPDVSLSLRFPLSRLSIRV